MDALKPVPGNFKHGASGYTNYGCRCDVCREGNTAYQAGYRQRRRVLAELLGPTSHGAAGYRYDGCRCAVCVAAKRAEKGRWPG